jgi:N-acetylmuramoyl-L-alanine amidase
MPKRFIVCAGHDLKDPGAIAYNGITEHQLTLELKELVCKELYEILKEGRFSSINGSVMEDDNHDKLWEVINYFNTFSSSDVAVDIHFNYNAPNATGTEVFISPNTKGENKARAIHCVREIAKVLGIPVRQGYDKVNVNGKIKNVYRDYKIPSESAVKTLGIIERTRPQVFLIEVCFLNSNDIPKYQENKQKVARIIAESLVM